MLNKLLEFFNFNDEDSPLLKLQFIMVFVMQFFFIGAIVWAVFEPLWEVIFVSLLGIVAVWIPLYFAKSDKFDMPIEFVFLFTLFIYGSLFLGEIRGYYTRFWWWDIVLHAGSGLALGFIGFLILYSLYKNKKLPISPGLLAMFSFSFALALGTIWEIFEFAMDNIFGLNMQKSGLRDTMWDLIVDAIGALIASLSGYFYVKNPKKGIGLFGHYFLTYFKKDK
jgi:hypothetical protein